MKLNVTVGSSCSDFTKCWFYKNSKCTVVPNRLLECDPIPKYCKCAVKLNEFFSSERKCKFILQEEDLSEISYLLEQEKLDRSFDECQYLEI